MLLFQDSCPLPEAAIFYPKESFWDPIKSRDISWNFEKFILDRRGKPLVRFLPKVEPEDIKYILQIVGNINTIKERTEIIKSIQVHLDNIEEKYRNT